MGSGGGMASFLPVGAAGGVTGILSDPLGTGAAANSAQQQAAAANNSTAMQQQIFNTDQANAQPYQQAGAQAVGQLSSSMPDLTRQFSMQDFQQNPGYQFQLGQGEQAMQRSAAAKGMLDSAGTQQNLNNYAQGMANTDYQQALTNFTNNQQQRYSMLSGLAGQGQSANAQVAGAGQNFGNQYGTNMAAIGNAQSAASMQGYNGMMGLAKTGATIGAAAMG